MTNRVCLASMKGGLLPLAASNWGEAEQQLHLSGHAGHPSSAVTSMKLIQNARMLPRLTHFSRHSSTLQATTTRQCHNII